MDVILASASPRRKELLGYLVDDFTIISSDVDEEKYRKLARSPEEFVAKLAVVKAKNILPQLITHEAVIMAADTIVVLGDKATWEIIGKPKDTNQAVTFLKKLRGQTHQVFSGVCVLQTKTNHVQTSHSVSDVRFKTYSDEDIQAYIKTYKPMDKAGAYAIQEVGDKFVEDYSSSLTGIIGLPVKQVAEMLKAAGVKLKTDWAKTLQQKLEVSEERL